MEHAEHKKERDWLADRVQHLKGLKSQTDQQRLLVALAEKEGRTELEEKKLAVLVRAEKAALRALKARQEAASLIYADKRAASEADRKARNHRLITQGVLFDLAGLEGRSRGEMLGLLLSAARVTDSANWAAWRDEGNALLAEKSEAIQRAEKDLQRALKEGGK
jgi:hypothetical protein